MDEKIGKKDQQDALGTEVEREALWGKKKGSVEIKKRVMKGGSK